MKKITVFAFSLIAMALAFTFTAFASTQEYGTVKIADAGIDVPVYSATAGDNLQAIVDAENSSCMFSNGSNTYIADHSFQGFGNLRTSVAAGSQASIATAAGEQRYQCQEVITAGHNNGSHLAYEDGTSIDSVYAGKLVMYTCNDDAANTITITIWDRA